jgi:hypothetical protein
MYLQQRNPTSSSTILVPYDNDALQLLRRLLQRPHAPAPADE